MSTTENKIVLTVQEVRLQDNPNIYRQVLVVAQTSPICPWKRPNFFDYKSYSSALVALHEGQVIGFVLFGFSQYAYYIFNLVVLPDYRGQGVGRKLIEEVIGNMRRYNRTRLAVCVRESNLAAQLFFRSLDFDLLQTLAGYFKEDTGEDAYHFVHRLPWDKEGDLWELPYRPWMVD